MTLPSNEPLYEHASPSVPIVTQPTETLSVPVNPPWRWIDVAWLVALFLLGAVLLAIVYSTALRQLSEALAPAIQVSGAITQVYLLMILGVYWFAIRRAGATWQQLGVRRPRTSWMLAVPAIFVIQLMALALSATLISYFNKGNYENPQLEALGQALAVPTPIATLTASSQAETLSTPEATLAETTPNAESSSVDAQLEQISRTVKLSVGDLIWLILSIGVIGPLGEELLFRGMIYPLQRRKQRIWVAILLNGLVFSIAHLIPILIPAFFAIGVILAWVRERSGSIWPSFALHVLQNSMAVYVIYSVVNSN
ncbi:MAG: CPBP family intramembrane glutamic endopeptidase [Caldilineaceae bacterium]